MTNIKKYTLGKQFQYGSNAICTITMKLWMVET